MDTYMSQDFTTDDIHDLRVRIAQQYSQMPKDEVERDIAYQAASAKKAMEALRKKDNSAAPKSK